MKKILPICWLFALSFAAMPVLAQKYKTAGDTVKLNKEHAKLVKSIADLDARLIMAQEDLPSYQSKAGNAEKDAADAAEASSNQASKANSGKIKDAKKAKRRANKAYGEAKDSRNATNNLSDQERKISRYQADLAKKQQQLQTLESMRAAIYNSIPPGATPVMQ